MRIILCGFGVVAQSFAKLLQSRTADLYTKYGLKPRIVGVFDSKGGVSDTSGLSLPKLLSVKMKHGSVKFYKKDNDKIRNVTMSGSLTVCDTVISYDKQGVNNICLINTSDAADYS